MSTLLILDTPAISDFDLSSFAEWLLEEGRSQKTIQAYQSDLGIFIAFFAEICAEAFSPELVTAQDLRKFREHSRELKSATWNRRLISLRLYFRFCKEKKLIRFNPMDRAGLHRREKQKAAPKSLSRNDFARLARVIDQDLNTARTENQRRLALRNRAMFGVMAYGALRVGEVHELRASHLLLSDRKGKIHVAHGKRDKEGDVNLGREGRIMINDWLEIHEDDADLFDGVSVRQVQRWLAEVGQRAGVHVTPHMLRHTAIRNVMVASGFDLALTQQFARHSRGDQTLRYALPQEEEIERVVENL